VTDWLDTQGETWKNTVAFVATDMCTVFKAAVRRALPHATLVVDHFHLVQLANQALTEVRRRVTVQVRGRRGRKGDREWELRNRLTRSAARMHGRHLHPMRHRPTSPRTPQTRLNSKSPDTPDTAALAARCAGGVRAVCTATPPSDGHLPDGSRPHGAGRNAYSSEGTLGMNIRRWLGRPAAAVARIGHLSHRRTTRVALTIASLLLGSTTAVALSTSAASADGAICDQTTSWGSPAPAPSVLLSATQYVGFAPGYSVGGPVNCPFELYKLNLIGQIGGGTNSSFVESTNNSGYWIGGGAPWTPADLGTWDERVVFPNGEWADMLFTVVNP
jgi:transposase